MQKRYIGLVLIAFTVFMGLFYVIPIAYTQFKAGSFFNQSISTVSVEEFDNYLNSERNTQLLDIRTEEEFNKKHIKGAALLQLEWIDDLGTQFKMMDLQTTYLVYSNSGERSYDMIQRMRALGFSSIVELDGGLNSWTAEGKPIETVDILK